MKSSGGCVLLTRTSPGPKPQTHWKMAKPSPWARLRQTAKPSFGLCVDVDSVHRKHPQQLSLPGCLWPADYLYRDWLNLPPRSTIAPRVPSFSIQELRPLDASSSGVSAISSCPATPVRSVPRALEAAVCLGVHYAPSHFQSPMLVMAFPTL